MPSDPSTALFSLLAQDAQKALAPASASYDTNDTLMAPLHLFNHDNQNEVKHYYFGHVMHFALSL